MIWREVSLLLEQFKSSDWGDLYVRTSRYSLFVAKPNGGPNPMRQSVGLHSSLEAPAEPQGTAVRAPHVGTVVWLADADSQVEQGSVVARIEVLGERIEIKSEIAGEVVSVLSELGALVEYETPLLRVLPRT